MGASVRRALIDEPVPYVAGRQSTGKLLSMNEHRDRYVTIPLAVLRRRGLSYGAIVTYGFLRDYAGDKEACWPSIGTLATDLGGVHRNTVHAYLTELVTAGILTIERRGQGRVNVYHFGCGVPTPSPEYAPPIVHDEEHAQSDVRDYAQSSVHEGEYAQPTVQLDALPVVHPYKEEQTPRNKTTPTNVGVAAGDDGHEQSGDAHSEQHDRAERLCGVLEIEPTSENVREMAGVVERWAGRCEAATDLTLEEKAFDCRQWLSDPTRNKDHRKSTVTFFRNTWLIRDVKKAEAARAAPQRDERSTGNGEHRGRSRADEATHAASTERRDAEHDRRLARHLARGGTKQSFYGL